ncbi:MAG: arginine N-succinyltransferase [Planctomycetota bacterium]
MFLIRQARPADLDDLHSLAKQTFFINLPPDRDIIAHKIAQSTASFQRLATGKSPAAASKLRAVVPGVKLDSGAGIRALTSHSDLFLLVLEDVEGRGVVGTSQVIAKMGGPGHPRVFLRLGTMTRRSESLKLEWTHQTANLETDSSGPTEIGGLILNHAFRGHKLRLGRLLSFTRFHLIGLFRRHFGARVVAEMLGPIDKNGYNPFFEKFTRHFIPRSFAEVYRFSQQSKEFITGLVPPGPIDLSIMDPEVAAAAGAVSDDTLPARRILERLGFASHDHIDPMDGGPHLEAPTGKISLVRATMRAKSLAPGSDSKTVRRDSIVSTIDRQGEFRAIQTPATLSPAGRLTIQRDAATHLLPSPQIIGVTPLVD